MQPKVGVQQKLVPPYQPQFRFAGGMFWSSLALLGSLPSECLGRAWHLTQLAFYGTVTAVGHYQQSGSQAPRSPRAGRLAQKTQERSCLRSVRTGASYG